MKKRQVKQRTAITALVIYTVVVALCAWLTIPAAAQFVDRILRPCGGTATGSVIVTTADIQLVPCPGHAVTINGVPITPGPGVTANPTVGVIPFLSAANVYSDSPLAVVAGNLTFSGKFTKYNNVVPADGQVFIGGTAAGNWTAGTIGVTAPIVVTNGNNTINISCPTCGTGSGTVSGTTNHLAKFTAATVAGNADDGNNTIIGGNVRTNTVSNTDLAGQLTIGGGGTATYTFTQTYTNAPIAVCSDTSATPSICGASATTTTLTVRSGAGNVVNYVVVGRN